MTEVYSKRLRGDRRRAAAAQGLRAGARHLRGGARTELRDAGRDPVSAHDRRRRRRHVHGARGHRRAAHGRRGARHLVHHQHGRRRAAAAAQPRRGDGGRAPVRASSSRCSRASLPDSDRPLTVASAAVAGSAQPPRHRRVVERRHGSRRNGGDEQPDPPLERRRKFRRDGCWRGARARARAALSEFKVGAALETADGAVITGCNIENATYGLTMCAERVAISRRCPKATPSSRASPSSPTPQRRRRRAAPAARSSGSSAATSRSCSPTCTRPPARTS